MDHTNQSVVPPLEWRSAEIHLEVAFDGKVRTFRIHGAFARIGSGDRCEIRIPNLGLPVAAYIQVGNGYLAVVELSSTVEMPRCEIQYLLPGGSVWLLPNARVTLEALRMDQVASEAFSWESYDMEDLRVLPNTLVLEALGAKNEAKERDNQFRLTSAISVLGTHPACQLQLKHRSVAPFQCVIFRGEHVGQPVRVVDLHALVPTQVGGRIAHGDILNVGARLICGKLILTARRMLTASPQQYVSSLPGMEMLKHRASDDGLLQPEIVLQDGLPAVQSSPWVSAVVIAAGDSKGASSPANSGAANGTALAGSAAMPSSKTQAPSTILASPTATSLSWGAPGGSIAPPSHLSFNLPANAQNHPGQPSDSANASQTLVGSATPWEESVERTMAELVSTMRACNDRLSLLERTLQSLPLLQATAHEPPASVSNHPDENATTLVEVHRILAAVTRLETAVASWQSGSPDPRTQPGATNTLPPRASHAPEHRHPHEPRVEWVARATGAVSQWIRGQSSRGSESGSQASPAGPAARAHEDAAPQALGTPSTEASRPVSQSDARPPKSGNRQNARGASSTKHSKGGGAKVPPASQSGRDASNERKGQPARTTHALSDSPSRPKSALGSNPPRSQPRANAEAGASDPDLSGVEELIADPMNPRLAASGSVQEALVLGSLVRLRQNKANTFARRLKWVFALFCLLMAIATPIAWSYIPEGWRNMIWVSLNPWDRGDATSP